MSQRHVERVIGRLLIDEELRLRFSRAPLETLNELCEQGWELNRGEIDALVQTDVQLWARAAARLPSRLQRSSLRSGEPDVHARDREQA
jgi:hypothetical protein